MIETTKSPKLKFILLKVNLSTRQYGDVGKNSNPKNPNEWFEGHHQLEKFVMED